MQALRKASGSRFCSCAFEPPHREIHASEALLHRSRISLQMKSGCWLWYNPCEKLLVLTFESLLTV